MKKYDFIFAGIGAAGLSLAYYLMRSTLRILSTVPTFPFLAAWANLKLLRRI